MAPAPSNPAFAPYTPYAPYVPSTTPAWPPWSWGEVLCGPPNGASTADSGVTITNAVLAPADENWLDLCQRTIADLKASTPPSA
jgi:hypothetical protein